MMKKKFTFTFGLFCILFFAFPMTSNAEWMTGAYLGYSVSDDEDVTRNINGFRQGKIRFDVDDSFVLGYRLGYWLESLPWLGISADISYFRPDFEFDFIYEDIEIGDDNGAQTIFPRTSGDPIL